MRKEMEQSGALSKLDNGTTSDGRSWRREGRWTNGPPQSVRTGSLTPHRALHLWNQNRLLLVLVRLG
ncbi:hypothetical protein ACXZ66_02020 [Corynebacterium sp. S7]